ncbi:hypothetical protein [Nocardioides panacisoli]|uniref:Lipoprotein n=1 Tax=Nocardioides panacisoli TaxID=627624 RepID=A0ABP7I024_9ACTN
MKSLTSAAVVGLLLLTLAGCGGPSFKFGADLAAPARSAYSGGDTAPGEDGRVDLEMDDGTRVVIWIDPRHIETVYQQHSDPDDPGSWTEPKVLYTAGDGCLFVNAATKGDVVAATLGCYGSDAFLQQAPDQGQAVVTTDLDDWRLYDAGELWGEPQIAGESVDWTESDVAWSQDRGFSG